MKKKLPCFIFATSLFFVIIILFLMPISRPNIILITIDALRADHLSCYGYKRHTSANIDNLAEEGTIFLEAIAPGTETSYSLPVILTSNFSHSHGPKQWHDVLVNPSAKTLAEILLENGYNTGLFSNYSQIILLRGVNRGFNTSIILENENAEGLTQRVLSWLRLNKNRKFFLWIHYFDPHSPYNPPYPYSLLYVKDKFNLNDENIPIATRDDIWTGLNNIPCAVAENNITSVNYYISQYDGEIRFTDEQIGVLVNNLKKLGLAKNTLIIISSDHGESLREHNRYFQHGGLPFDTLLRVPLIFKYDPITHKNKIIEEQVSSADIVPTLFDILKIKYPKSVEGKSFFCLFKGKKEKYDKYAFSKCAVSIYSLRTKEWKLIYFGNSKKYALYDLENDKEEMIENEKKNIRNEEIAFLRKKLNEFVERDKRKCAISPKIPPFDKDAIEKLKSLGYLQGE